MGQEFTRQELYDLVWREPLRTLAKTLHISDVRLAKICRRANIPLPGLGYWAKRAYGKARPGQASTALASARFGPEQHGHCRRPSFVVHPTILPA